MSFPWSHKMRQNHQILSISSIVSIYNQSYWFATFLTITQYDVSRQPCISTVIYSAHFLNPDFPLKQSLPSFISPSIFDVWSNYQLDLMVLRLLIYLLCVTLGHFNPFEIEFSISWMKQWLTRIAARKLQKRRMDFPDLSLLYFVRYIDVSPFLLVTWAVRNFTEIKTWLLTYWIYR